MNFLLKYIQDDGVKSFLISASFHAFVFMAITFLANLTYPGSFGLPSGAGEGQGTGYYAAELEGEKEAAQLNEKVTKEETPVEKNKSEDKIYNKDSEKKSTETKSTSKNYSEVSNSGKEKSTGIKGTGNDAGLGNGRFSNYSAGFGDTTNLKNIYKENTLNVRIYYPSGWTFVDQNRKNKLDGVTFWANYGNLNPPPYIFLEVADKYLFDPRRYTKKLEMNNFTLYYNDPESISGQVKQSVYIRTNTDEDYIIKLMIKGETEFKAFQPEFFGMIKTFKFGHSWF